MLKLNVHSAELLFVFSIDHAHLPQTLSHPPHYPATNGFLSQDSCYPLTDSEWQSSGYCSSFPEGGERRERVPVVLNTHKQSWSCEAAEDVAVWRDGHTSDSQRYVDSGRNKWKGGQCESEDGVGEEGGILEERIRAHVKFLSSGTCASVTPNTCFCVPHQYSSVLLCTVSSLVNAQHQLSVVTTSDLRITLRDTVLSATRGESSLIPNPHSYSTLPDFTP